MKLAQKLAIKYIRTKFRLLSSFSKKKAADLAFELFCTPQVRNKKKLPPIFERAEKIRFQFNEEKIVGYRWNHPQPNKALIIHGFESSVVNFDRYIRPLEKQGFEVLAFDAPAHGRSSGKQINAIIYRDFLIKICETYGPMQAYMAHSFGGLSLCLALEELPHMHGDRVVLIAPATETTTAIDQFFRFLHLDGEVRKEFEKKIEDFRGHPSSWYSIKRAINNIKAQILWFHDEEDQTTPLSDALKVKDMTLPNVEFVITKGLGHRRIYRENKVSRRIIEFFSQRPS